MMPEDKNCYLVYRRNFERRNDDVGRTEVLGCYLNLRDANRRARKEIKRVYQNADKDIAKPPKDCSHEDRYGSLLELNDKHMGIHRVLVFVKWMACQPKYDSDEDSVLGDEEEDAQVKSGPASQEPRPYPLPRGRPSCLNGLRFSVVGDQHPYSSAEIESLIRQYGEVFHDWEKLRRTGDPVLPLVTLIFGSVPQRPHPGPELTELYKYRGIEWFRDQGFLFIDHKKLFVMIESLSGTTLLRPDLKRSLDADETLERAEADAKRRRM